MKNYLNEKTGLWSWLSTLDHKRIGLLYLFSVLTFFFIGGIFALLLRLELFTVGETIMGPEAYNQIMTLHGVMMVFMVIIPGVPAIFGNFFLPLQIGAKDVAFPRLNLLSWYLLMTGALVAIVSVVTGGVDTGWTFYTPYSIRTDNGTIWVVVGAFIMGFSSILTGLNFIVTVHKLRAPGMGFFKMPLFVWGIYSTAVIQVLATPVLAITLLLLTLERMFGIGIFDPKLGGDPVLFQHFFWFYSHPAVYIMILPAMGIVSELMATFSRNNIFGYKAIAFSSVGIALVSFFVWGHHMFVSGQSDAANFLFSIITMLVGVPTAIKVFNWVSTMYKGSLSFETPFLYALGFIFVFLIGGMTGIVLATLALDVHVHDTYYVVAHFHYVMVGGTLFPLVGAIFYWFPKMFGKMYSELLGRTAFALIFLGFNVTFFPLFFAGTQGMPRRYYDYIKPYETLNQISTVGSWLISAGFLLVLIAIIHSLLKGKKAPDNPWDGRTLEWQTQSPPIHENFEKQPEVTRGPYER
ncbi:MAG: cytochrome c oxidase subunit I [Bdellovibrionales bacterium]|nr:cytochrome c oxidase subunit I [Bdellovibrionales bacterium]